MDTSEKQNQEIKPTGLKAVADSWVKEFNEIHNTRIIYKTDIKSFIHVKFKDYKKQK